MLTLPVRYWFHSETSVAHQRHSCWFMLENRGQKAN